MSAAWLARGVSAAAAPAAKSSARRPETGAISTSASSSPLLASALAQTRCPDDPRRDMRLTVDTRVAIVAIVAIAPRLNDASRPFRLVSFSGVVMSGHFFFYNKDWRKAFRDTSRSKATSTFVRYAGVPCAFRPSATHTMACSRMARAPIRRTAMLSGGFEAFEPSA